MVLRKVFVSRQEGRNRRLQKMALLLVLALLLVTVCYSSDVMLFDATDQTCMQSSGRVTRREDPL